MNEVTTARQIWHRFSQLPGSQHIARQYAVYGLIHWLRKVQPRLVVEVGAGIGTLTYTSLVALNDLYGNDRQAGFRFVTIENDTFCLEQLRRNLDSWQPDMEVIHEVDQLAGLGPIEFLIIDGGDPKETGYYTNLAPGAVVFVESNRGDQRNNLTKVNAQRRFARTYCRAVDGDGRYWVYKFEPALKELVAFAGINMLTGMRVLLYRVLRHFVTRDEMRAFYSCFSKLYSYPKAGDLDQI